MASLRSEYDDKNLKKNAFSGRRLKIELDRLNNQKGQVSKQFRHEEDQLRKQLAEGEGILKSKNLTDPSEIRPPLSTNDMKKLSPRFARKLSGTQLSVLPPIVTPPLHLPAISKTGQTPPKGKRRLSLPPTIVLQECVQTDQKRSCDSLSTPKLLQRRSSANNALQAEDITSRMNDFFQKLSKSCENVNGECQTDKDEDLSENFNPGAQIMFP